MVKRSFEAGEPVLARDYRNQRTAWTKGVIQDRLGPVTYRVQVGKLFWKRHIDQLRELTGSKVADLEPVNYQRLIWLNRQMQLCLCQSQTHHHNHHRFKSPLCPWCHLHQLNRLSCYKMSRLIVFQVCQAFQKKTNVLQQEFEQDQNV